MTIQQAIEKAKQLRKERGAGQVLQARVETSREAAIDHTQTVIDQPAPPRKVPAMKFREVLPDLTCCTDHRVLINTDRTSSTAAAYDAYRIIRTQLRQKGATKGWKRFAITSAGSSEGKSTTAVNLALALAREKRENVFLLDLDLRRPSIASYLGLTPPAEIGQFLTGEGVASELFFSIGVGNLSIAAGTHAFENSSELLSNTRTTDLLSFISNQDPDAWIVVDLPPLLATADALVVAPKMSATIVVVSEGKTRRDELQRVAEMLSGVEIAGVVLNRSKQAAGSYDKYY